MKHKTTSGMVKAMREIRDKISNEIKDMSFEEERAYLDKLLKSRPVRPVHNKII
jgi:hypothetical protein